MWVVGGKGWTVTYPRRPLMCLCSCLEAEGMEKTYKFKQEDIATAVPLASSLQVR